MFVGFSAEQERLSKMLDSMAGLVNGQRDALTRYTQPLTGSYYFAMITALQLESKFDSTVISQDEIGKIAAKMFDALFIDPQNKS